jgi:hypothetical protein
MLRALRGSGRLVNVLVSVLTAMVLLGTLDWWHADDEDGAPVAFHNHSAHHPLLKPVRIAVRAPDHCYLCHWLRTLGNGFGSVAEYRLAPYQERHVLLIASCRTSDLVAALVPARAPPA